MFTDPSGHEKIMELVDFLFDFEKFLRENDLSSLSVLYRTYSKSFGELASLVTNKKLSEAICDVAAGYEKLAKNLSNGGTLDDIANFEQIAANKIISTMK